MNPESINGAAANEVDFDEESSNAIIFIEPENSEIYDWDKLAEIATSIACTTKFSACLLGLVDDNPTKHQPKIKILDKNVFPAVEQIKKIHEEINNQPIPLYKLMSDPTDMCNTAGIKSLLEMLVKNSILIIDKDEDGFLVVIPAPEDHNFDENSFEESFFTLSEKLIKKMIEKYDIKEKLLVLE